MTKTLKAPFPYFGGKSRIAAPIWQRFGCPENYVEPFAGSLAVLLACPSPGHTETVNDADGLLANFWRALRADPDAVAEHADYPVSELDLHARHRWLVNQRAEVEQLLADPEWYDAKIAGWWVWGISQWIGSGWCPPARVADVGELTRKLPHIGDARMGVHRAANAHARSEQIEQRLPWKRPVVAGTGGRTHRGRGVHRSAFGRPSAGDAGAVRSNFGKLPKIGANGTGHESLSSGTMRQEHRSNPGALRDYLRQLAARLRRTRVTCGDFARVLGPSVTWRHGLTAVLLDPPYDLTERAAVYAVETDAAHRARDWAIENGDNPLLRIALCGYDSIDMPTGWRMLRWKTSGGYGSQGEGRGRENAGREVVWFSPHCLDLNALPLFAGLEAA